jgi:hypothetical protein
VLAKRRNVLSNAVAQAETRASFKQRRPVVGAFLNDSMPRACVGQSHRRCDLGECAAYRLARRGRTKNHNGTLGTIPGNIDPLQPPTCSTS